MIKNLGFLSYSNHLMNKVIPSIKRNKNIIPSAILSLGNKVNNDQYFQNSKENSRDRTYGKFIDYVFSLFIQIKLFLK
jgi:hypothetical protein